MTVLPGFIAKARWVLLLAPFSLLVACSGGDGPSEPSDDPPDGNDPPDVQLVTLEVIARLDSDFQEIGGELGWEGGAVPDALVTVRRLESQSVDSVEADVNGMAVFEELLEGNYTISAVRMLESSERAQLSGRNADINVLGGATTTQLRPTREERTLDIRGGRRGSLLISELYNAGIDGAGGSYNWAHFMELFNNGDTVVYLDGLLVGGAWSKSEDAGPYPCSDYDFFLSDPEGVWARIFFRFPGTGRSHPLPPGETAILATDAIDHGEFVEGGPDLSNADFEFFGRNDVDNPAVPNLVSVGPGVDKVRRGLIFQTVAAVPFIARPVDIETLPRRTIVIQTESDYVRIPRKALIDVGQFTWSGGSSPLCDHLVDPSLDHAVGNIGANEFTSLQRRVLYETGDGQAVLQDTDNSDRDFENSSRTPGEVGG